MKQINPLYLIGVLSVILIVMLMSLNSIKKEATDIKQDIANVTQLANDIVALKKSWGNKKIAKSKLLKVLHAQSIKSAGVTYKVSGSKVVISAKNIEKKPFNYLMNKLLNGNFTLSSMKLRRLDKTHVKADIEVAL